MRNLRAIISRGLIAALAAMGGCAGKIQYPSLYTLNPPPPAAPSAVSTPKAGTVAVRQFDAPAFLREGPIVYRESPGQVSFYHYHRWAQDPRRAVTTVVIREMQARELFHSVDAYDGREADCLMTGAIDHLEEVDSGPRVSVEVALSARLIDLHTGEVLWRGSASKIEALDQRSVPGVVDAMSRELGEVADELVASMRNELATKPSASRPSGNQR